jgi:hypothetical protein
MPRRARDPCHRQSNKTMPLCSSKTLTGVAGTRQRGWAVVFALIYRVVVRLLSLMAVRGRGEASKDVGLVLLRREVSVLRPQHHDPY